MSLRYRLPCEKCGHIHRVELRQAGGTLTCECGETVQIPTMLKLKRLESEDDAAVAQAPVAVSLENQQKPSFTASVSAPEQGDKKKRRRSESRIGIFLISAIIFIIAVFCVCRNARTLSPQAVFYKQTVYDLGDGRTVRRDTTPVSPEDFAFYFCADLTDPTGRRTYFVDDNFIDWMPAFDAYRYFYNVKSLELSDNFYENYAALKSKRLIWLVVWSVLAVLSLVSALVALFKKESRKQVGVMRGSDWR